MVAVAGVNEAIAGDVVDIVELEVGFTSRIQQEESRVSLSWTPPGPVTGPDTTEVTKHDEAGVEAELRGENFQLGDLRLQGLPVVNQEDGNFLLILTQLGDFCSEEFPAAVSGKTAGTQDWMNSAWCRAGLTSGLDL